MNGSCRVYANQHWTINIRLKSMELIYDLWIYFCEGKPKCVGASEAELWPPKSFHRFVTVKAHIQGTTNINDMEIHPVVIKTVEWVFLTLTLTFVSLLMFLLIIFPHTQCAYIPNKFEIKHIHLKCEFTYLKKNNLSGPNMGQTKHTCIS